MTREQIEKILKESDNRLGNLTDKQLLQYESNEYKKGSILGGKIAGLKNANKMKEIQKIGCILGGKAREVPVLCFTKDGKFVKEYSSATSAANKLKIHRSDITAVCKGRGKVKTVGGFVWKYK